MFENMITSLCSGLIGGIFGVVIGALLVSYRIGRWQQHVEDRLHQVELRLDKGSLKIDQVPALMARLTAIIRELRQIHVKYDDLLKVVVPRTECALRHKEPQPTPAK